MWSTWFSVVSAPEASQAVTKKATAAAAPREAGGGAWQVEASPGMWETLPPDVKLDCFQHKSQVLRYVLMGVAVATS